MYNIESRKNLNMQLNWKESSESDVSKENY